MVKKIVEAHRSPRYSEPRDGNTKLSYEISLRNSDQNHTVTPFVPAESLFEAGEQNLRGSVTEKPQDFLVDVEKYGCSDILVLDIVGTRRHVDNEGHSSAILYLRGSKQDTQPTLHRWIHMQHETRTFDAFMNSTLEVPKLTEEQKVLVSSLLSTVRDEYKKPMFRGPSFTSIVLRCDGNPQQQLTIPTKYGIFFSFPYNSLQRLQSRSKHPDKRFDLMQTLLQSQYPMESTSFRDEEQITNISDSDSITKAIHVSQIWGVILSSGLIITSAPHELEALMGKSITCSRILDSSSNGPLLVQIVDPWRCLFFFTIEQCNTWFALMNKIINICLVHEDINLEGFQLFRDDGAIVRAENWPSLIQAKGHTIITITVYLLTSDVQKSIFTATDSMHDAVPASRRSSQDNFDSTSGTNTRSDRPPIRQESFRQDMALARRASYKDNFEPVEPERYVEDEIEDELPAPRRRPTFGHEQNLRGKKNASDSDYKSNKDSQVTAPRINTALVRASKNTDAEPAPRVHKYPAKVSIEVVNVQDEEDDHSIYYVPHTLDRRTSIESSNLHLKSRKTEIKGNERHTKVENRLSKEVQAFLSQLKSGLGPNATFEQSRQDITEIPPALNWKVGKPSGSTDRETKNRDRQSNTPAQAANSPQSMLQKDPIGGILNRTNERLQHKQSNDDARLYNRANRGSVTIAHQTIRQILEKSIGQSHNSPTGQQEAQHMDLTYEGLAYEIFKILSNLYEFFVPLKYPCAVAEKYWGSLNTLLASTNLLYKKHNMASTAGSNSTEKRTDYVVVGLLDKTHKDIYQYLQLEDLKGCSDCRNGRRYRNESDAMYHLLETHCSSTLLLKKDTVLRNKLKECICKLDELWGHQCKMSSLKILEEVRGYCIDICTRQQEIIHGVTYDGAIDESVYRMPNAFLQAFERLVQFVVYAAFMAEAACTKADEQQADDSISCTTLFNDKEQADSLLYRGFAAETSLLEAQHQLILMANVGDYSDRVGFEAVGPEFIAHLICNNLQSHLPLREGLDVVSNLRDCLSKLKYQIHQHPGKRLIQDINRFSEEVGIIRDIMDEQQRIIWRLMDVCNPDTIKVTTWNRIALFDIEEPFGNAYRTEVLGSHHALKELSSSADRLKEQTRQSIEIQQEDHGKVILVFTIVTIVFLPLSFVTSLLGMNTADIRNSSSTQALFWAISLPLTGVVVALSLLVGYKGYEIREAFGKRFPGLRASEQSEERENGDVNRPVHTKLRPGNRWAYKSQT